MWNFLRFKPSIHFNRATSLWRPHYECRLVFYFLLGNALMYALILIAVLASHPCEWHGPEIIHKKNRDHAHQSVLPTLLGLLASASLFHLRSNPIFGWVLSSRPFSSCYSSFHCAMPPSAPAHLSLRENEWPRSLGEKERGAGVGQRLAQYLYHTGAFLTPNSHLFTKTRGFETLFCLCTA